MVLQPESALSDNQGGITMVVDEELNNQLIIVRFVRKALVDRFGLLCLMSGLPDSG
jgi:hypothetical protein